MYNIISQDSVTAIIRGVPYTVASDHTRYDDLIAAIRADDVDKAYDIVTAATEISTILANFGDVEVFGGHVMYRGEEMHNYLVDRILETVRIGQDVAPLGHFLDKVLQNPSRRAVEDLYKWCEKARMPLTSDGCIIAYKIVNHNFTDCYTGKFDNSPGKVVEVPRNQVDEDPDRTCSHGLHFCSAEYLPHYGPGNKKVVLVKVSPADVVAFPRDYNLSKARCCKYEVMEEIPASKAATFFADYTDTYYDGADVDDDLTIEDRITRLEQKLGLSSWGDDTFAARMDEIDNELGLDRVDPLIERIQKAEAAAGIA